MAVGPPCFSAYPKKHGGLGISHKNIYSISAPKCKPCDATTTCCSLPRRGCQSSKGKPTCEQINTVMCPGKQRGFRLPWAIKENSDTSSRYLRGSGKSPKRRQLQNEGLRSDDGCYDTGLG